MNKTPFEIMIETVKNAGYSNLEEISTSEGAHGFKYEDENVIFYIGEPTGKEWYWYLDGKIAIDNSKAFDKWSRCPLYVWLPENDAEAQKILKAIKFLATEEGYKISNEYDDCFDMFGGFEIPINK